MPIAKKKYMTLAIVVTILVVVCMIFVPTTYKWFGILAGYLVLLMISLAYQKTNKKCMAKIKELDETRQYSKLVDYINAIKPLGYNGFVVDSYLLYAHYELGDFKAYEETVLSIRKTRAWSRPKFNDFREKVVDNLACIRFLKDLADTGEVQYKGDNILMMQAITYYKQNDKEAIISLMNDYPKVPKLKKACLYVLSNHFEALEGFYESEIATNLINEIKERCNHG